MIVGAGAAGLTAAIFAAETARAAGVPTRIALVESAPAIGAKILVSGGGRCNVTHYDVAAEDFNGLRPVVRNVLAAFDVARTVAWFASMGVSLKREETGKLFPTTDRARTVVDALVTRCQDLGVALRCGHRVQDVTVEPAATGPDPGAGRDRDASVAPGSGFLVHDSEGTLRARRLVLATGGRSLPRTGSDGHGWEILRRLGHGVTPTYPALVPLLLADGFFHAELSGVSTPATLSTVAGGRRIDRRSGSLLFTHLGVSGPVVMDASRHWIVARAADPGASMHCSFVPDASIDLAERRLMSVLQARSRASLLRLLAPQERSDETSTFARLPERLATALLRTAELDPHTRGAELSRPDRRRLVHALTALQLPIVRDRGWNHAEVTAGGVPLPEIDHRTMESRRQPGLHLAGELLDCDGRIGGFNFQWAWATGFLAGRAATRALLR